MKDILIGVLAIGIGTLLCFAGYVVARITLPIWGFFVGFLMGASGVSDALNSQFLGTTLGIVVGLVMGLVFGLLAYFFFSLAIVLLGASLGYWLGTGFITMIGFDKGFLSATVGITLGVAFAVLAIIINAPKYYLIIATSLSGAVAIVGGVLIAFNQLQIESLSYVEATNIINLPLFWSVVAIVLGLVGISIQVKNNSGREIETWGTPFADTKNVKQ